jgi:hypothetical protein
MFLSKLNSTGSALLYSTYVGGSSYDVGISIVVDGSGDAYVGGYTESLNFPVTPGAFQATCDNCVVNSGDAFITEVNPSGSSLLYSTYLGGSLEDAANGIALDASGDIYLAGLTISTNFPTTAGSFQPTASATSTGGFVTKFAAGSTSGTDFSLSPATGSDCPTGGNCSTSATVNRRANDDLQPPGCAGERVQRNSYVKLQRFTFTINLFRHTFLSPAKWNIGLSVHRDSYEHFRCSCGATSPAV